MEATCFEPHPICGLGFPRPACPWQSDITERRKSGGILIHPTCMVLFFLVKDCHELYLLACEQRNGFGALKKCAISRGSGKGKIPCSITFALP